MVSDAVSIKPMLFPANSLQSTPCMLHNMHATATHNKTQVDTQNLAVAPRCSPKQQNAKHNQKTFSQYKSFCIFSLRPAAKYEEVHAFSDFANWLIPGKLLVGRYPYVEPSRCKTYEEGELHLQGRAGQG